MLENLSKKQVERIFDALPVELIFVDESEKVRYWNKGEKRKLKISDIVLGNDLRSCHKKESLPMVEQLVSDLKSGKEDKVVLWSSYSRRILNFFIALRDNDGKYLGILEYIVDLKGLEKLAEENEDAYRQQP